MKLELCKFYNPLFPTKCVLGNRGTLMCHTENVYCESYEFSETNWNEKVEVEQ